MEKNGKSIIDKLVVTLNVNPFYQTLIILISPIITGFILSFISHSAGLSSYWSLAYMFLGFVALYLTYAFTEDNEFEKKLKAEKNDSNEEEIEDDKTGEIIGMFLTMTFIYTAGFMAYTGNIWGIFKFSEVLIACLFFIVVSISAIIDLFKNHKPSCSTEAK